jgi:hypothetical protein
LLAALDFQSFFSVWYWVLTVTVWTQICHRTLGVPYDMILRGDRLPDVAANVDAVARITAARLATIHRVAGPWLAAGGGFMLSTLAVLGFSSRVEAAAAAFLLLLPLSVVALQTLRLASWIVRRDVAGAMLRRALARRRAWNQAIAIGAILTAALVAVLRQPGMLLR